MDLSNADVKVVSGKEVYDLVVQERDLLRVKLSELVECVKKYACYNFEVNNCIHVVSSNREDIVERVRRHNESASADNRPLASVVAGNDIAKILDKLPTIGESFLQEIEGYRALQVHLEKCVICGDKPYRIFPVCRKHMKEV